VLRNRSVDGRDIMYPCFVCGQSFHFGPHVYDGRAVQGWNCAAICKVCESSNQNGLMPDQWPDLIGNLQRQGVRVKLNARGRIDIPK
jgi:hypothetical protein